MAQQNRLKLHEQLRFLCPNCYYQPPKNIQMTYPCIVYNKAGVIDLYAQNNKYLSRDEYMVTVIDRDPDSEIPESILKTFTMSSFQDAFVQDNLHHTVLTINI